jgi:hypothetical protein
LADRVRPEVLDEVRHVMGRIYNLFARHPSGSTAFFLEDDVVPPDDACARLAALLDQGAFSASAAVAGRHERYRRGEPIAWRWSAEGEREDLPWGRGVQRVGGNGFGCAAVNGAVIRQAVFRSGPPWDDFDFNFYHDTVQSQGRKAVIDWECRCRHHDSANVWV